MNLVFNFLLVSHSSVTSNFCFEVLNEIKQLAAHEFPMQLEGFGDEEIQGPTPAQSSDERNIMGARSSPTNGNTVQRGRQALQNLWKNWVGTT